jgi:hypothetical protein
VKSKFKVLCSDIQALIEAQASIVLATCCLHNIIKASESEDHGFFTAADSPPFPYMQKDLFRENTPADQAEVQHERDGIGAAMWMQYEEVRQAQEALDEEIGEYIEEQDDDDVIDDM